MKSLAMMALILLGALTLLGNNDALAEAPHGHTWAKTHFDAMDTNNDGKISYDEHTAICEKRFKAMDTDNDGFVTREEAPKAWHERKERRGEKIKKRHSHGQPAPLPSQMTPDESEGSSH